MSSFEGHFFLCPNCGGHKFRSSGPLGSLTGHCSSEIPVIEDGNLTITTCKFSWDRKEDWKYLHVLIRRNSPEDKIGEKVLPIYVNNIWG